jgi:hypothetical protein
MGAMEKFSELTLERGKRPDALGRQIQDGYIRLLQIPTREFTPHIWDQMTKRYKMAGLG